MVNKEVRKLISITISESVLDKIKKEKQKTGASISRQLELAWVEKYG